MPYVGTYFDSSAMNAGLSAAREVFNQMVLRALERTAQLASQYAQYGSFVSRTGALRASIKWGVQMGTDGGTAVVRASAPWALFVENGTKQHLIFPRRKQFLRFVQNGAVRFSKGVIHPGTRPRKFMAEAQEKATPFLEGLLNEAVVRAFA